MSLPVIGLIVFVIAFVLIIANVFNTASIALLGAIVFIFLNILHGENVYTSIDWNVIFLLIGMMIIVNVLRRTGVFQFLAIHLVKFSKGNTALLLILLSFVTGVLSAFFDNVTTILLIIPITLLISTELAISPVPFVLSQIFSSNIGGAATLIGDPPNLIIGSAANIDFVTFLAEMGPPALMILVLVNFLALVLWHKDIRTTEARKKRVMNFDPNSFLKDRKELVFCLSVTLLVFVGFSLHSVIGVDAGFIALCGAAILILKNKGEELEEIFAKVEWETIFFFIGLFIMVQGLVNLGLLEIVSDAFIEFTDGNKAITAVSLLWISGIASGIINNVPFVATMTPIVIDLNADLGLSTHVLWWAMAMGACFGGNLTLVGASANVVGISVLSKNNVNISFGKFFKYGVLFTFLSLIISTLYLWLKYFL